MKEWVDKAPGIFAIGTAGVLLLTILHELGYFLIVGFQFQSFLSVSDYFANSILWLPYFALYFLLGVAWGELTSPTHRGVNGPPLKMFLKIFVVFIIVSAVVVLIFDFLSGVAFLVAIGAIAFFVRFLKRSKDADRQFPHWVIYLGVTVPIVGALAFLNGVTDGRSDLTASGPHVSLHMKSESVDEDVIILRMFDRGVLAMNTASKLIEFFRWKEIQKISTSVPIGKKRCGTGGQYVGSTALANESPRNRVLGAPILDRVEVKPKL
jgi:hypothetical protein